MVRNIWGRKREFRLTPEEFEELVNYNGYKSGEDYNERLALTIFNNNLKIQSGNI